MAWAGGLAIRILDVGDVSAAFCGRLLVGLGAEVVRVEPPGGDPLRAADPLAFAHWRAGQRSVTLDLDTAAGRARFLALVRTADVVVETFPPGHLEARGLGYTRLAAVRPELVLVSVTPFGQWGPRAGWRGTDLTAAALGGMMSLCGEPEGPPLRPPREQASHLAGLHAAIGALLALRARRRTGRGQHVDVSVQEAVAATLEYGALAWIHQGVVHRRRGSRYPYVPHALFRTRDGFVAGGIAGSPRMWEGLLAWMAEHGQAGELEDPRFADEAVRMRERERIFAAIEAFTLGFGKAEFAAEAQRRRLPWAPVDGPAEVLANPQLRARGFFVEVEWDGGTATDAGFAFGFPHGRRPGRLRVPALGEADGEFLGPGDTADGGTSAGPPPAVVADAAAPRGAADTTPGDTPFLRRTAGSDARAGGDAGAGAGGTGGRAPQGVRVEAGALPDRIDSPGAGGERPPGDPRPRSEPGADVAVARRGAGGRDPAAGGPRPADASPTPAARVEPSELGAGRPGAGRPPRGARALEGVRVLDLTWVLAGPHATRLLADHGAEVIKVESRHRPDPTRFARTHYLARRADHHPDASGYFNDVNRGKRSVALNLARPEGRELLRRLAAVSDVLIENFSARVLAGWGLDYPALRALRPDIILVSMAGMGQTGPWRDALTYADALAARAGLTAQAGFPGRDPVGVTFGLGDLIAGLHAALATLAALEYRDATGEGQHVDLSQVEAVAAHLGPSLLEASTGGGGPALLGNRHPRMAPHGAFPCRGEDRWCAIAVPDDAAWRALARLLGRPELGDDPRFATAPARKAHEAEVETLLGAWTRAQEAERVMAACQAAGIPAGVVQDGRDLVEHDEHLRARGFYVTLEHPVAGAFPHEGVVARLADTPGRVDRPAPRLGEHTREVLAGLLGLAEAELAAYAAAGVLE